MDQRNVESFRSAAAAFETGDFQRWLAEFDPSMQMHVPGALGWSAGDALGPDALTALWKTMHKWSDGSYDHRIVEVHGGGDLVVSINQVVASRNGETLSYNTTWTYRYRDGKVGEAWLISSLQDDVLAQFWGREVAAA